MCIHDLPTGDYVCLCKQCLQKRRNEWVPKLGGDSQ